MGGALDTGLVPKRSLWEIAGIRHQSRRVGMESDRKYFETQEDSPRNAVLWDRVRELERLLKSVQEQLAKVTSERDSLMHVVLRLGGH
jgi:hypothetical protein